MAAIDSVKYVSRAEKLSMLKARRQTEQKKEEKEAKARKDRVDALERRQMRQERRLLHREEALMEKARKTRQNEAKESQVERVERWLTMLGYMMCVMFAVVDLVTCLVLLSGTDSGALRVYPSLFIRMKDKPPFADVVVKAGLLEGCVQHMYVGMGDVFNRGQVEFCENWRTDLLDAEEHPGAKTLRAVQGLTFLMLLLMMLQITSFVTELCLRAAKVKTHRIRAILPSCLSISAMSAKLLVMVTSAAFVHQVTGSVQVTRRTDLYALQPSDQLVQGGGEGAAKLALSLVYTVTSLACLEQKAFSKLLKKIDRKKQPAVKAEDKQHNNNQQDKSDDIAPYDI